MTKIIEQIEKYSLAIGVSLYCIFTITLTASPVVSSKLILLLIMATIGVVAWSLKNYFKNTLSFSSGKYDLAVLVLTLAHIGATIFKTPNKMEALVSPGVTSFVFFSAIIYFLINQFNKQGKNVVTTSIVISGILLSISSIFTQMGLFTKIPQLPAFFKDLSFSPLGGSVPTIIYLVITLLLGLHLVIKNDDVIKKSFWGMSLAILIIGLVISIINSMPGNPQSPRFPTLKTSWEVTVDTLKNSPLWGAGPGNYLTAFNLYRSVSYNQTDLWQVRFNTGSNYYLTLITELGFAGLLGLILLATAVYKNVRQFKFDNLENITLLLMLLLLAFLPISPILLLPLFLLLSLNSGSENKRFEIEIPTKVPSAIIGAIFVLLIVVIDSFAFKYVRAEYTFKIALESLAKNDANTTYQTMQKAISQNPYVDRYHSSLAQVDMAIASSLASQKDVSDAQRQTITQLVQNAIAEGKNTVSLNPQRSGNWEVLAQVYRSIMPFAQGADQFAIQTYTQAVALDPTNPNLRIALGGVYYALGKYDEAIDSYKLAVLAKPDLANSHYNLAVAYRDKKDYDSAIAEINSVLSLVAKDSEDYTLAQNMLTDLKKNKPAGDSANLNAPDKLEETNIDPAIELTNESTPPSGQ